MKISYTFKDQKLLNQALTHPSLRKNKGVIGYERLEFLGDSIIGMIIAELVYHKFPQLPEGQLSVMLSNLVNTKAMSDIALNIGLSENMKMDYGEEKSGGRHNQKNLENCLESLIAAVYLDSDFLTVKQLVAELWQEKINHVDSLTSRDAKSLIQEWAQKHGKPLPTYKLIEQGGSPHDPSFSIELTVEGLMPVIGKGKSKKQAQLEAAQLLLESIK
jgi:ribonuclease III